VETYRKEGSDKVPFSGRRIKRGLYLQSDGKVMNADINGSVNIGRKYNERSFKYSRSTG
jgi:transposase